MYRDSGPGFNFTLWPFAAFYSLSPPFPVQFFSCPIPNKGPKRKGRKEGRNKGRKKEREGKKEIEPVI